MDDTTLSNSLARENISTSVTTPYNNSVTPYNSVTIYNNSPPKSIFSSLWCSSSEPNLFPKHPPPTGKKELENSAKYQEATTMFPTKSSYMDILREKRRDIIEKHYGHILQQHAQRIKQDAEKMKPCHYTMHFNVPEDLDIDVMENRLMCYFSDLGFTTRLEPRKEDTRIVSITLC